jgi:hypothetical protein
VGMHYSKSRANRFGFFEDITLADVVTVGWAECKIGRHR